MYEVAYVVVNAKWELVTKMKSFKTAKARERHIEKLREKGTLHRVLVYRDC